MTFGFDLTDVIKAIGLIGVMAIIFAESGLLVGFLFPGDSLLFTAGILASQHLLNVNIHVLVILLFLSAVFGDSVGYAFGRRVGKRIFRREESLLFHPENIRRAEAFYERHGGKTIILARFVPMVRAFAPIVAGVGRMKYRKFVAFNFVGGFLWTASMTYLGYILGTKVPNIDHYVLPIIGFIIVISLAPPAIHLLKDKENRTRARAGLKNLRKRKIF
ncbi:MAG TPA: VTT domain-containing protein [Candidatus Saccharimonadales bacterium]|nr:VTT domain-containing protein [Candidatus Saccharimonadales bacterium]